MVEIVAALGAIIAALGAWVFGRSQYRAGQVKGAKGERRRTQEVTKALARRLRSSDDRIMREVERAQDFEAQELARTLDLGPTPVQVQDLLEEADELGPDDPTKDLDKLEATKGLDS